MDTSLIAQTSQFSAQSGHAAALQARADKMKSGAAQSPEKMRAAAQEFEAFFVGQMMEYMSVGIKANDTFGGGHAEDTWRSMMNQEYGKEIAKRGGLGITDMVVKSMLEIQEKRAAAAEKLMNAGMPVSPAQPNETATQNAAVAAGTLARRSVMA